MEQKILYMALVLDPKSSDVLRQYAEELNPFTGQNFNTFCHHMTIAFNNGNIPDDIMQWVNEHLEQGFTAHVTSFGYNDKAAAVGINTDVPSTNMHKHITLFTNADNNGKPVDSNNITNWSALPEYDKFDVHGTIKIFYKTIK